MTTTGPDQPVSGTKHPIRKRLISGALVIVPFIVTLQILLWLLGLAAGFMRPLVLTTMRLLTELRFVQTIPDFSIDVIVSIVSIALLLGFAYLIGMTAQVVAGRKFIDLGETLMLRIPVVRSIYAAAKQVIQTFSLPDQKGFRSVVMIEFPRPGFKSLGFLTGTINDEWGNEYAKVFIPTSPNPTTGFFELVPVNEIVSLDIPYEEAFKMIISGGIIAPPVLRSTLMPGSSVPGKPMAESPDRQPS
jgi:uncharacterized membrane protein